MPPRQAADPCVHRGVGGTILGMQSALAPLATFTSGWSWAIILFIVILLFGKRLPGVARSLGKGITEFKKGLNEGDATKTERKMDDPPAPRERTTADKSSIDDTSV